MTEFTQIQHDDNVHEPQGHLTAGGDEMVAERQFAPWAAEEGNLTDLLDAQALSDLGAKVVSEWREDKASRNEWEETVKAALNDAAQETEEGASRLAGTGKNYPFENASDVRYPLLTVAANQFNARAYPAIVKGDEAVGMRVFGPPPEPPEIPEQTQMVTQQDPRAAMMLQQVMEQYEAEKAQYEARKERADRIKQWLNYCLFYRMEDWEGDTDTLLSQIPIVGMGFRKVYPTPEGVRSEYISALHLTVHQDTKTLDRCPRITHDFEAYPYELEAKMAVGVYRTVDLQAADKDKQKPRTVLEQHRLHDLDGDGYPEPYIVTVDEKTEQVLRVEAAYGPDDVRDGWIERWQPFIPYPFLMDPKGRFYAIGYGKLLKPLVDSIDTSINQLIDAGNAEIAGGGFIGSTIRLGGTGQSGALYFSPGEYKFVNSMGAALKDAIYERTVPHPSAVTFSLLEMLQGQAQNISGVQDVLLGDTPSTAPVGTTLAKIDQSLAQFTAIYKRVYRSLKDEFRLIFKCQRRWATDEDRRLYAEITGGDFDQDFEGDETDIIPVSDPAVVTRQQAIARAQTVLQIAETPVGQAAGMLAPEPAQALLGDVLDTIDWPEPKRLFSKPQPNPEVVAKMQESDAKVALTQAQTAKTQAEIPKIAADTNKLRADTVAVLTPEPEEPATEKRA